MTNTSTTETVYKCDACSRSVRVESKQRSVDVLGRCIITEHCTGVLHQVSNPRERNHAPAHTPPVTGVRDWFPRKVLATKRQTIARREWKFTHKLGALPVVDVVVDRVDQNGNKVEFELPTHLYDVIINDSNTVTVVFTRAESGTIQCIGSSSAAGEDAAVVSLDDVSHGIQLSSNTHCVFAVPEAVAQLSLEFTWITGDVSTKKTITSPVNGAAMVAAWSAAQRVMINHRTYALCSINISDVIVDHAMNGTSVKIAARYNGSLVNPWYALLVQPPVDHLMHQCDAIIDKLVNMTNDHSTPPNIYLQNGELTISPTVVRPIYPHIKVVD